MSSIPNYKMKKNNTLGIKPKKKTIPININTNPTPGKFLFSNHINNIASSYLSMGQRMNKNIKASKIIHVNTNSATNYYTLNSKDTKQTNGSITNSILNNLKINNKSELASININNYINLSNNEHSLPQKYEIKGFSKDRKQLSTLSNSKISNDIQINGYQSSKLNINNSKFKNKINNATNINNLSKNKQTYSTRPNFLDSKNKTKKIPMKSKIRQYKFQNKNNKFISTSFNNVYSTKRNFQTKYQRDLLNFVRADLYNNFINEKNFDVFGKTNTHNNMIHNKNLNEIKNRHNRHNTASFGNKEIIMNIFHKKNLSNKIDNNINNLINNINEEIDKNLNKNNIKNSKNIANTQKESNSGIHNKIMNKINISHNSRKKIKKLSNGKINDIKILVNEKRINIKDSKHNSNNNSNILNTNNHNFYYTKYLSNNHHTNNTSNIIHHHIKNPTANNINININGIRKIMVRPRDARKINVNHNNKIVSKPIPTPGQKIKGNLIPSQRNIKINLAKFLQGVKTKQNNKTKDILGRKSFSIKKIANDNNTDFSLPQFNDKLSNKLLKSKEEENNIKNYDAIKKKLNNLKIEEIEKNEEFVEKSEKNRYYQNDILKSKNYNKIIIENKLYNNPDDLINVFCPNNIKNSNKNNYMGKNYYSSNSTSNNNYYGNNKIDYSIDNIPEPINNNNNQNKKSNDIDNYLQNENYLINSNKNDNIEPKKKIKEKNSIEILINKKQVICIEKNDKKIIDSKIKNNLFDEENLDELPEDYDENFNDLYSIINKINFGSVLVCVEGLFTPEGRTYKRYKEKFDKFFDKLYTKKGNSFSNSNNKPKKIIEVAGLTSNTKTTSSSSKKNVVNPNEKYNDLNIVKELNVNC